MDVQNLFYIEERSTTKLGKLLVSLLHPISFAKYFSYMKKIIAYITVKFYTLLNYTKSLAMLAVLISLQSETSQFFFKESW